MTLSCCHWVAVALILALFSCSMPWDTARAQEAVWNMRTPEWEAVWPTIPNDAKVRLDVITVASQLTGYSGQLLPVQRISQNDTAIPPGHVPVDVA